MTPRLIPNAIHVARHAWSVRLSLLAGVCASLLQALPLVQSCLPGWLYASLTLFCAIGTPLFSFGAAGSRLVKQQVLEQ